MLKAHGYRPTFTKTANLDLRREAGSRWLEGGVPLHTIRDWLGHTSIAQTSTYLAGTMQTQRDPKPTVPARVLLAVAFGRAVRSAPRDLKPSWRGGDRSPRETDRNYAGCVCLSRVYSPYVLSPAAARSARSRIGTIENAFVSIACLLLVRISAMEDCRLL